MKRLIFTLSILVAALCTAHAQNIFPSSGSAGIGTIAPNPSSLMEMMSTTKGLLIPRMTRVQRDAVVSPATGLMIYQTNATPGFYYYDGSAWRPVAVNGPNKTLSNLTGPTAVNVDLVPNSNDSLSLGSSSHAWKNVYAGSSYYIGTGKVIDISGGNNTFLGVTSNLVNTGNGNTFTGANAGSNNTIGSLNTSAGAFSLLNNTTGGDNTANGYAALEFTNGYRNTAVGTYALTHDTSGNDNTAIGASALYTNTWGWSNTAVGSSSLYSNTTGTYNTACGEKALQWNGSGAVNAAFGMQSLYSNSTGSYNTALGAASLYNANAYSNTGIGVKSLYETSSGDNNTAIGYYAGYDNYTGHDNTFIGYNSDCSSTNLFNASGFGSNTIVTASNQVRIGNNSITSIGGYVNWTNISDGRVKKNIKQNVPGLAFINKLQPVTYNLDLAAADKIMQRPEIKDKDGKTIQPSKEDVSTRNEKEKVLYTGFVAQDVEKAAKTLNYDFSGVDAAKNDHDLYGLRYSDFVVPLVKAVQELSQKNDDMERRVEKLEAILNAQQANETSDLQTANLNSSSLEQNAPNPFNASTTIKYYLPVNNGTAYINFYNNNGVILKSVKLTGTGKGSVILNAEEFSSGTYHYSLLTDGKIAATKQMILAK